MIIEDYITYVTSVKRYSARTCQIYSDSLQMFCDFISAGEDDAPEDVNAGIMDKENCGKATARIDDNLLIESLKPTIIRSYEVYLLDERQMTPRTVNLHLSVLSGLCRFLVMRGILKSNPVKAVTRPKEAKKLPEFYRAESMQDYFLRTEPDISPDTIYVSPIPKRTKYMYDRRLARAIVSTLFNTGMRRAELIGLKVGSIDFGRKVLKVLGKGDKMREIPIIPSLFEEISLYLQAVETMVGVERNATSPLFVTFSGKAIYPQFVERVVKSELGSVSSITGRKSPHVLRHTLATELLNGGTDLNSIKELLGHSSLAATQVYTHNSIAKLQKVYKSAHPRATKSGGKNGD